MIYEYYMLRTNEYRTSIPDTSVLYYIVFRVKGDPSTEINMTETQFNNIFNKIIIEITKK